MNATLILSIQLALAFLCPPFELGSRKIFPSDLWCMAWVFGCVLLSAAYPRLLEKMKLPRIEFRRAGVKKFFISSAVLFFIIFLHGSARPSLIEPLKAVNLELLESDNFQFTREFVIMLRFLSWLWAAVIAFQWARTGALKPKVLLASLTAVSVLCAVFIIASKFSLPLRYWLGNVYGYDPDYVFWATRRYGTFSSPVEASAALVFSTLLLLGDFIPMLFIIIAIFFTKTISSIVGAFFAALSVLLIGNRKVDRKTLTSFAIFLSLGLFACVALVYEFSNYSSFFHDKSLNLVYRIGPWKLYFLESLKRPDLLLFGFGFTPYHSDSIFVFLFNRGGLLLLGSFLYFGIRWISQHWNQWSLKQRIIPLFILLSGVTCDILIYRACATIAFTTAACILAFPKSLRIR
jgi:hypothetical protein